MTRYFLLCLKNLDFRSKKSVAKSTIIMATGAHAKKESRPSGLLSFFFDHSQFPKQEVACILKLQSFSNHPEENHPDISVEIALEGSSEDTCDRTPDHSSGEPPDHDPEQRVQQVPDQAPEQTSPSPPQAEQGTVPIQQQQGTPQQASQSKNLNARKELLS